MFNIESEYDKYRREAEFVEIEGYNENGEMIEDDGGLFKQIFLFLSFVGAIVGLGYFGYDYINNNENPHKTAVMGVFVEKGDGHISRQKIESDLNTIYQEEEKQKKLAETINSVVDEFVARKDSKVSTKDISSELNGIVDMFYENKKIPEKLDNIVEDFYSKNDELKREDRYVTVQEGDTLAKISQKFYNNPMEFQKIIDANYQLQESSTLRIGQKIYIPY